MVGQAATVVPPNEAVSTASQKEEVQTAINTKGQANGHPPELQDKAAQAAIRVQQKYTEEREKRLRDDGDAQYVDLSLTDKFQSYAEDPWLDERSDKVTIEDGETIKYLILGAGWGGVQFAVQLIKAGIPASDLRIVDTAGGFGGTWYYNRYPGLMCDVEAYVYLPLLEEMGYMPKHKYSYGDEIRDYMNAVADKFDISDTAMFSTKINSLTWDDTASTWKVNMVKSRRSQAPINLNATAHTIISAPGLLLHPKLPAVSGIERFEGKAFHTSRWAYDITGGSQANPTLDKLKDKRVGIIGTGATAVQAIPHLAKYAKHLTIFQRTPSSVDTRDQRPTDLSTWKSISSEANWWKSRNLSFVRHISDPNAKVPDLVNDRWTQSQSYRALVGGADTPTTPEEIPAFVASLHALDMPRAERVRARAAEIVKDEKTAASLQAYYPIWCKRPCFHDDYLPVFNQPNVTLVDTDGKGVDSLTANAAVVDGKEYPLDILIFSTGFRSPMIGSPASRAGMKVKGKNGRDMEEKFDECFTTLHGCMTRDFPNFFFPGPFQAGATANANFMTSIISRHVAYVISQAEKKNKGKRVVIEPTEVAEQMWTGEIAKRSMAFAGLAGCTPGYLNGEGSIDKIPMEKKMKMAGVGVWGEGVEGYMNVVEAWEKDGRMEGLDVKAL